MKTTFYQTLFAILMAFTALPAAAYDFEIDGLGYTVESFTDMTCVVGAVEGNTASEITIPETVTYKGRTLKVVGIANNGFQGCRSLTSIFIPNSVTSLGWWSFAGCSSLSSVSIPNSITSIYDRAFGGCSSLTSISIPNSVTYMGSEVFFLCTSLTSVSIPNSVTNLGIGTFKDCTSLTSVSIPNSVTNIGSSAFSGCSSLASITIPNSVTDIGTAAFNGCTSLTSVSIPGSVTVIQGNAFYGCSSLVSVIIPNSVTDIGSRAFYGCTSLTSVSISNSVTVINAHTFSSCTSLASVSIPNSVKTINPYAFEGCDDLKTFALGNCDQIRVFSNRIKDLTLIESFEYEAKDRTVDCRDLELEKLTSLCPTPPQCFYFSHSQFLNLPVYVPTSALTTYQADALWGQFWNLQGGAENVTGITDVQIEKKNSDTDIYDLNGVKVTHTTPGQIYIKNGTKFIAQ